MSGKPEAVDVALAFVVAAAVAWLLVPLAERLARRIGALDYPNERSLHTTPTPKLSGLAILIAVLVGGLLFLPWVPLTQAILAGAIVITVVGAVDDLFDLPAALKLARTGGRRDDPGPQRSPGRELHGSVLRPRRAELGRAIGRSRSSATSILATCSRCWGSSP